MPFRIYILMDFAKSECGVFVFGISFDTYTWLKRESFEIMNAFESLPPPLLLQNEQLSIEWAMDRTNQSIGGKKKKNTNCFQFQFNVFRFQNGLSMHYSLRYKSINVHKINKRNNHTTNVQSSNMPSNPQYPNYL